VGKRKRKTLVEYKKCCRNKKKTKQKQSLAWNWNLRITICRLIH